MHISDMLGQYKRNVNNGTEELRSSQGVQKLVSTVGELSTGSVFEGTVNSVRGGRVTLALGNGQMILARLDGKVDIKPGMAMFFQVKSNDGSLVSIRPYNGVGNAGNPILLNALTAAQVPVAERTLAMVDAMMQEQMPVDRQSILDMVKILTANPESNVQTIVQMTKLGMPVTQEMAAQFEAYLSDRHALLGEMELAVGQLAEVLGDEEIPPKDVFALYSKAVDIFTASDVTADYAGFTGKTQADALFAQLGKTELSGQQGDKTIMKAQLEGTQAENLLSMLGDNASETGLNAVQSDGIQNTAPEGTIQSNVLPEGAIQSNVLPEGAIQSSAEKSAQLQGDTLGNILSQEELSQLAKILKDMPALVGNETLFAGEHTEEVFVDTLCEEAAFANVINGQKATEAGEEQAAVREAVLHRDMPVGEFMHTLRAALLENAEYGFTGMQKLFARKEFQKLFRGMAEQQWLLKPQELKEEEKVTKLYEKMEKQINQLESAVKSLGITQNSFLQTVADIHGNVEFMNQMNQIYHYVQIPLKMSGQNANGELYVYTNKKALNDPEAELTAFLHLDMDNLGATDVSVRMRDKQVKTNFYFEDDASYNLVQMHLPILEKRLKNKGYDCSITITNEKKNVNFRDNFVKRGKTSAGSVHRYSFDVRA